MSREADKVRTLHIFFVYQWLADWLKYYKEANQTATANAAAKKSRRQKTSVTLLEHEVSEHSAYLFDQICQFLQSRIEVMKEELQKKACSKSSNVEREFLANQMLAFLLASTNFYTGQCRLRNMSIASAQSMMQQFEGQEVILAVFNRQIVIARTDLSALADFNANICKLMTEVSALL